MTPAYMGVTQHQRITQHLVQWNTFVLEQRMPCRHRDREGPLQTTLATMPSPTSPDWAPLRHTDRHAALDLLRHCHLEHAQLDFGPLLPT